MRSSSNGGIITAAQRADRRPAARAIAPATGDPRHRYGRRRKETMKRLLILSLLVATAVAAAATTTTVATASALISANGQAGSERLAFLHGAIETAPCGVIYTMNADGSDQLRLAGRNVHRGFPTRSGARQTV